ncbi:MAG: Xaa-Pro peptidase family protein [Acidobacteriia bacterium]|nr:Xaa-Pro peptidase family protein [Terriglobia bacterium]
MTKTISWSSLSRRNFLQAGAGASALAALAPIGSGQALRASAGAELPPAFAGLKPLGERVRPIEVAEYRGRLAQAQQLMNQPAEGRLDGLFIPFGSSLYYFTGVRWWPSERLAALLVPRTGEAVVVCPAFEEGRLREQLRLPVEVRVWQEDESAARLAAQAFADRGVKCGRIGFEETTAFTFLEHFRREAPGYECVSADAVTIGCRARKSEHELELMRLSCEATCDVFRAVFASLREGMTQGEIVEMVESGYARMGLHGEALVLIGASAALPHGSVKPGRLREGDAVLIDGGTTVEHYASDVTRTGVLGKPGAKVQAAFEILRRAQDVALEAARAGRFSGTVDDAARGVVTGAGFGPGYKYFTHRLGHGIGLDGHEHPYLVRGSKTVLEAGMTFSNEPGIYVPGEYGVRCEDDMVVTADGPAKLLTPGFAVSLEKPLG